MADQKSVVGPVSPLMSPVSRPDDQDQQQRFFDDNFLDNIEQNALECSQNFSVLMRNLRESLHYVSHNSVEYMECYKTASDRLNEQVQASVLATHGLILKCQQLDNDFQKIQELQKQIREIRQMTDTFDAHVTKMLKKKDF
eukprot:TRINITY_DN4139_c0_g1_i1.p1 TRINITY_DN4139_c0_g1~~TRINITY_DN4139_c0_g1_i1.p1  ORF type:complete len:141 (-),score=32.98 TRINITY_DN4139_c0_g1_i1:38-460(-)